MELPRERDLVVIGAGMTGAACAWYAARAGLRVAVLDRGAVAGGTTGAGEGNLLVSDKEPGPELDLALLSTRLWREIAEDAEFGSQLEYEAKGGLVVAAKPEGLAALEALATEQRRSGVVAESVPENALSELEPQIARGLAGGVYYPQDAQVQPARAAALLIRDARRRGATLHTGTTVTALTRDASGAVTGVVTDRGTVRASWVLNAAGTWGGDVAQLAGAHLPVMPRRGFVLVTEPLPRLIRHKVYAADYVANVASGSAALQSSAVIEGTAAGPVLIGASRERVGFDRTFSLEVARLLARRAIELFPALAQVKAMRSYLGFRPYLPDHLPAIGPDPRAPGLLHACGHEGAGIGLAPATGHLITQILTGKSPDLDLTPFRPERFETGSPA
ncbi:FAD-dependent oxidoreductase [Actinospica sp.]|uniref:NAD(P)/FAD-dependent oxidoreductase n=1 Tax=Actinospica sp. TaxID=1872142 RepID=UPI002CE46EC2|nr:FAD-dependent oxidoreductase [Actinospica sp.]HWG22538.1 FAD-dependent oxidoreductase [Actinospica sp.]